MRRLAYYAVAIATTATAYITPSHAAAIDPLGRKCAMTTMTDVTREAGWRTGEIDAGPLLTLAGGTLRCSIHVNNNTHSGPAVASVSASATAGLVAVNPPQELHFQATDADDVSLCTDWYPDAGTPLYWVAGNPLNGDTGHWTTSSTASCNMGGYICVVTSDGAVCVYY